MQRTLLFQDLVQDLRIGIRSLLRVPVLTLTIIVTVGLGIGATAAIFSAINAAMLRPLPYAQPDRLVRIYTDTPPFKFRFSVVDYLAFTEQQTRFERARHLHRSRGELQQRRDRRAAAHARGVVGVLLRARHHSRCSAATSAKPTARPGSPPVALASHAFWQQRLGGRADAIGKPVRLDGADYTLIGVMPPAVGPLERRYDLFLIQQFTPPRRKGPFFYSVIARLPDGADRQLAAERAARDQPRALPDLEVVVPGRQVDVEDGGSQDQPGRRRQRDCRPRARRCRPGVADRLRERLEPVDRARHEPAAGAGGPRRPRRDRAGASSATCSSKAGCSPPAPLSLGGGDRLRRHAAAADRTARRTSRARGEIRFDAAMAWLMLGARAVERAAVRPRAGVERHGRQRSTNRCDRADRRPAASASAACAGRWSARSSRSPRRC